MLDVSFSSEYNICGSHVKYKSFEDLKNRQNELYDTIKYIDCSGCKLKKLPELPELLEVLVCNDNNLIELPVLPSGLKSLYCIRNNLTYLPKLPEELNELWCQFNKIKLLPRIPDSLCTLVCDCNEIEKFPNIHFGIRTLHCSYNKIRVLPNSPDLFYINNVGSLRISDNPVTDLMSKRYDKSIRDHMREYMKEKEAVDIISEWFMNCKYNPKYKYCRNRLLEEHENIYGD